MSQQSSRAARARLDVACELVALPGGAHRIVLSFRDWAEGVGMSTHDDFEGEGAEDRALEGVASAIVLFQLRRLPGRDQWQSAPSPEFRRATRRVADGVRRRRARERGQSTVVRVTKKDGEQ